MIGDRKILCIKPPATVELYDFPEPNYAHVEDILTRAPSAPARDPNWSHTFSSDGRIYCSPPYGDGTMYRFVVSTNQGIWGLVFPAMEEGAPLVTQLSTFSNRRAVCVPGIRKALALYGEGTSNVRIGYSWDEVGGDMPSRYINGTPQTSPFYGRYSAFDEENGRFVWHRMDNIMILDLLHKVSGDLTAEMNTHINFVNKPGPVTFTNFCQ